MRIVVYTDGACLGGALPRAGWGVWFGAKDERNCCGRVPGKQTNQRAELFAILQALRLTTGALLICSDSQTSIDTMTVWYKGWLKNGWLTAHRRPVENQPLIRALLATSAGRDVQYRHVSAHSGIEGNEGADALAKCGARTSCPRPK